MSQVRCAIYTRKSSEEGLEQSFNSLDAQREACAAYVLSQASEGWTALPDRYDDGGLSGGTLERPALQRLLQDIADAKVDIVVVYKVDRLSRSLLDFAKLVEAFDRADVSFVSVTQSFNTTTSMGRLTLNMLLSFAQFEREVTAERIRDKITASKAKGMWMGGLPPLGYEPDGRTLKIVPEHAALVRQIFARYLALGNVRLVADELIDQGVVIPRRSLRSGRPIGGGSFSRGQLYAILRSPIYVGDIPHKDVVHKGLHEAIIDRATWQRVRAKLTDNTQGERRGVRSAADSPLAGKVSDASGAALGVSHANKGQRRYRYYVGGGEADGATIRIPAVELEGAVAACLAGALDDPLELCAKASFEVSSANLAQLMQRAAELATNLKRRDQSTLRSLISAVRVQPNGVHVDCDTQALVTALHVNRSPGTPDAVELAHAVELRRSGRAVRLVQSSGALLDAPPSTSLVNLIIRSRHWWAILRAGELDVTRLAVREQVTPSYLTRVVRLAFLSPAVVEAIIAGSVRAEVDGAMITLGGILPGDWDEQRRQLLPA